MFLRCLRDHMDCRMWTDSSGWILSAYVVFFPGINSNSTDPVTFTCPYFTTTITLPGNVHLPAFRHRLSQIIYDNTDNVSQNIGRDSFDTTWHPNGLKRIIFPKYKYIAGCIGFELRSSTLDFMYQTVAGDTLNLSIPSTYATTFTGNTFTIARTDSASFSIAPSNVYTMKACGFTNKTGTTHTITLKDVQHSYVLVQHNYERAYTIPITNDCRIYTGWGNLRVAWSLLNNEAFQYLPYNDVRIEYVSVPDIRTSIHYKYRWSCPKSPGSVCRLLTHYGVIQDGVDGIYTAVFATNLTPYQKLLKNMYVVGTFITHIPQPVNVTVSPTRYDGTTEYTIQHVTAQDKVFTDVRDGDILDLDGFYSDGTPSCDIGFLWKEPVYI